MVVGQSQKPLPRQYPQPPLVRLGLHQGRDGKVIQPANDHEADSPLVKRERLGGLLNYYYREAA